MVILTILGAVWSLDWWLSSQFKATRDLVYVKIESLQNNFMDKLDYHEKHDDKRFGQIIDDLWAIKVRNAAIDGTKEKVNG